MTRKDERALTWEILNIIGTISFAISGAIVAMEEEYDILGVYFFRFNHCLWRWSHSKPPYRSPDFCFMGSRTIIFNGDYRDYDCVSFPKYSLKHWEQTGLYTDAVGLSAFAVQGALYATEMNHPY